MLICALWLAVLTAVAADDSLPQSPLAESWDYAPAMRSVAARFHGRSGVVLHIGDSLTYANPYGQWARAGEGKTPEDLAALEWMHAGRDDDRDGWWLCRFDHPAGGRSYTACGGMTLAELLAGGKQGLESLPDLVAKYRPQLIVLMIGSNDAAQRRSVADYRKDLDRALDEMLAQAAIPIVSTIPPHPRQRQLAAHYNDAIRQTARERKLPLIDLEREILLRRPNDWNGTLLEQNDPHLSTVRGEINATSAPTEAHLRESGYLLRGWLSVRKIVEVKRRVQDASEALPRTKPKPAPAPNPEPSPKPGPSGAEKPAPPSAAERIRLPVVRDTWFSNVGGEADGNLGGAGRLKLKSIQEMSLVDFDPAQLQGRVVRAATLHVRLASDERLHRVTVGSFAAPWVEGASTSYAPEAGSSTYNHARHPEAPWSFPGSDLCDVMLGRGGTVWRSADASEPDAERWQRIAIDPRVIAARVAGLSYGCLLFDDTGSEWSREGERFSLRLFPNRFVFSRESGVGRAPYFSVELGVPDREPPAAPDRLTADVAELPAGETWLSWRTPSDRGAAGVLGFFVDIDGRSAPRYLVPAAGAPGENVSMRLRDLGLAAGAKATVAVSAVDAAGNRGPSVQLEFEVSRRLPAKLPRLPMLERVAARRWPRLGRAEVAVIDALDKVQPVSGEMIPAHPADYLAANHLWDAATKTIRLHAAKNEFVDFQLLLRGPAPKFHAEIVFADAPGIVASLSRLPHVQTPRGPLPDPVVETGAAGEAGGTSGPADGGRLVELYVPHDTPSGRRRGTLRLRCGESDSLELPIELEVWDFTLPDYLSFIPEMNCYQLPANERDYYRLAHRHRTVLNRVPYYQSGAVADGCAPREDGGRLDWSAWDRRFGPYLDGSAFADLPRRGVPLECFYLPLHENWPSPMAGNYRGGYWADRAFPAEYRQAFVEASRQFAEHFSARGWHDTLFHCFLNGKNNFKAEGWSKGSSPWLLDEPANFQDFWALCYFGRAFHEGVGQANGAARMAFRCDISRPEWQRDVLDDVLDYNVVGGAFRRYRRMVLDRKQACGQLVVEYGSSNAIEHSNVQPAAWCLDAWSLGADGVLPWQTVGRAESWQQADSLALFYPDAAGAGSKPTASLRLKAYRRGQQDVEYLTLWARAARQPRWAVGEAVRQSLGLSGVRTASDSEAAGAEDAGVIQFAKLLPADLWRLRIAIGKDLSQRKPPAARRLVDFRPRPRNVEIGADSNPALFDCDGR